MKRYPFAPLEALIITAADDPTLNSTRLVADTLGRSLQQVYRWRGYGVTADQADELATRVGLHPFEVWPELADDLIAAESRSCEDCGGAFVPMRKDARFCSRACYRRHQSAEVVAAYWRDPERARRKRRRRYKLNREAERRKAAERYQRTRDARLAYQREYKARKRAEARAHREAEAA